METYPSVTLAQYCPVPGVSLVSDLELDHFDQGRLIEDKEEVYREKTYYNPHYPAYPPHSSTRPL